MTFPEFFLVSSSLILVTTLFLLRSRDARLKQFGLAGSLTLGVLLSGAVLRLIDSASEAATHLLVDTITVANLSAASILLIVWTVRIWKSSD